MSSNSSPTTIESPAAIYPVTVAPLLAGTTDASVGLPYSSHNAFGVLLTAPFLPLLMSFGCVLCAVPVTGYTVIEGSDMLPGDFHVPKNTFVGFSPYVIQRMEVCPRM